METLNAIYSKTYNFVYLRAKSIFNKEEDAQQLMKEIYVKAMEEDVREDRLYAWLGRQVYSLGCGKFRKKKVREADFIELGEDEYYASNSVYMEKTVEAIGEILEELPDMYQATLYAFYYDHLKIKEISVLMGYSPKVILNRLNYIHKYLSKALKFQAEERELDLEFSVEALCEALKEWSLKNRLDEVVAQNIFGSICRELSIQSEYESEEETMAGADERMVKKEAEMDALIEEMEHYGEYRKFMLDPKLFLCVGGVAVVILLIVFLFSCGKSEKKEEPKDQDHVQQEEFFEEEPWDEELDEQPQDEQQSVENPSEYILPNSDTVRYTRTELEALTLEELRLARNEIYARHDVIFGPDDLKAHFGSKSWYTPKITFDQFNELPPEQGLNQIERDNVSLIVQLEDEKAQ